MDCSHFEKSPLFTLKPSAYNYCICTNCNELFVSKYNTHRGDYTNEPLNQTLDEEYIIKNSDQFDWSGFVFYHRLYSYDFQRRFYNELKKSVKLIDIADMIKKQKKDLYGGV